MNLRLLFFFIVAGATITVEAQNLSQHNWYFGNKGSAVRFNRATNQPFIVTNNAITVGTGGTAVATNPWNADILFYSDGVNVYNANNQVMPNGTGLNANTGANQPVVVSSKPGDSTKFYIFTNTAHYPTTGSIYLDTLDMSQFGGSVFPSPPLGDVLNPKNKAVPLLTGRSEGMIVISNTSQKDTLWLITHKSGSQDYAVTRIDKTRTFPTTVYTISSNAPPPGQIPISVANFAYNKKLKKLAVSPQSPNADPLILNFDETTGTLTFDRYIYNIGQATTTNQSIYDIEWDNKGQYLYLSRVGETGINADVLQYDYTNSTVPPNPVVTLTKSVLQTPEYRSWGLQLAPDSAIYHIYQTASGGPFLVEKFTKTDTVASSVIETPLPFGAIDFGGTQFPSFVPRIFFKLQLSFTSTGDCQNGNTMFFPNVSPNADSLVWNLQDTVMTGWSPVYKYATSGTKTVTLKAYYGGQIDSVTQTITIKPFTLQLQLVSDTTACHCQLPINHVSCSMPQFSVTAKTSGGTGTPTFLWSDGVTTSATLKPDSAGYYYVVATDGSGCSTYAGVNIKEYGKTDQRANIWYFGNNAGMDFNGLFRTPPTGIVALDGSNMDAPAGCAIVCDRNGQTIFYTDGNQVWDKKHNSIATGIGGDPNSSQSAIIVSVPGDETLFYIFTTQAINGLSGNELRYSLYDLKMNNGAGGMVQQDVLLFSKSTERLTASPDWLIAHEYGNNTFRAYHITQGGLGDPVFSAIGSDHSFNYASNGEGYMKLGPGPKNNLAVALSTSGTSNFVELFHFNDSTGTLSDYRKIDLKHPAGQVYGIEFSPGGNKLFASIKDTPSSDIYEYSIDSLNHPHLKKDNVVTGTVGALQLAPDNQIYFAINGSTVLGTIQPVEDTTKISPINPNGFTLKSGTNSNLGLPNFIQHQGSGFGGPAFSFTGVCLGDSTKFVGTPTDPIDKFQWFFGDGGGSTIGSPTHLYADTGTYTVKMRLTNRCGLDTTVTQQVTIHSKPKNSLPKATPLCTTPVTLHSNTPSAGTYTYLWSTGATTESIIVSNPTTVSVTNTNMYGCSYTVAGSVVDNRPQVNFGPDQTVCQNSFVNALNAQNAGDTYVWTLNGVANGNVSQTQGVSTTAFGIFTYAVTVTDPVTSCFTNAQVTFTIMQSPAFTLTGTNPSACNVSDGKVTATGISSAHLYTYNLIGSTGTIYAISSNQNAASQPATTGLGAGTYTATITDQVSGCATLNSVGLTNNNFTITPSTANACDAPKLTIATSTGGAWTYTVTNSSTGVVTSSSVPFTGASQIVQLPSQGSGTTISYVVQVTDNGGCVVNSTYPITTTTVTAPSLNYNVCTVTISNTASATGYQWTGPPGGITSGSTSSSITIGASGTYQMTATSSGCPISASITVDYNGKLSPGFTQSDPCQNQVVLSATPIGNYTYRWYENNYTSVNQIGQQISIGTHYNDSTFVVEVVDVQSGCSVKSSSSVVQVVGPITASLSAPTVCDDGKKFVITATTSASNPDYTWTLPDGSSFTNKLDTVWRSASGVYQVVVKVATCSAPTSIQIEKAPIPIGLLAPEYRVCLDPDSQNPSYKSVTLDPGFFTAYNWYKNGIQLSPVVITRTYTADSDGQYKVDLTNEFGCTNFDQTNVINDCEPVIAAPTAFRPASSHLENNKFHVIGLYISSFEIIVYNRWGEAIYQWQDESLNKGDSIWDLFGWNGGYKGDVGKPLPGDTYTYLVRYVSSFHPERGTQEYRGSVVLLR